MSNEIASEVLAASLGGAISASVLYPLEVLKTKLQAEQEETSSMIEFAKSLYRRYGLGVFFSGMETSAFQSAVEKALYFFAYTGLKEMRNVMISNKPMDTLTNLTLGCAAEWAHLPITLPLDCWTTKIQTTTDNKTAMQLLLTLLKEPPGRLYKGWQTYVVLCFKPALQYTVFEQVKAIMVRSRSDKTLSAAEAFSLGMLARAVATIGVFPYIRAKVVMQTKTNKTSIASLLRELYSQGGIAAWYQGIGPELTRGIFSAALMMMIKEKIAAFVQTALGNNKKQLMRKYRR